MSVGRTLRQTLHELDVYTPSDDLFDRVVRSVEEDRAHRKRVRTAIAGVVGAAVVIGLVLLGTLQVVDGQMSWPWWVLELLITAILVAMVVVLGPLIRRFGGIFATAVFRANPPTAHRFLALLDVAFYLVFFAYVLLTSRIEPETAWLAVDGQVEQVRHLTFRLGGMLMLMGVLHSATIAVLPVLGLVFASSWRRIHQGPMLRPARSGPGS